MIRRTLLIPFLIVALAGIAQAKENAKSPANAAAEQELLKLENKENQAFLNRDTKVLDRLYADTLAWTRPNGEFLNKAQVLENLRSGKTKYDSIKHHDVRVRIYGNTAILTGTSTTDLVYGGKPMNRFRWFGEVWVKQNGRWQLVAREVSPGPSK
ncbi:MAG: nuclear transport factor 2 family protein [Terriglobia bacterium]